MTWENVHRILSEKIFLLSSIYIIDPNFAGILNMHMHSQQGYIKEFTVVIACGYV